MSSLHSATMAPISVVCERDAVRVQFHDGETLRDQEREQRGERERADACRGCVDTSVVERGAAARTEGDLCARASVRLVEKRIALVACDQVVMVRS